MAESIGEFYPTQVPSYTEAADIRKAFNLYHYGTETVPTSLGQINSASMAGYIRDTLAAIDAIVEGQSVIIALESTQNLNGIVATGVYHTPTVIPPNHASLSYPAGKQALLIVYKNNEYVYQTFTTNDIGATPPTRSYFRVGVYSVATLSWTFGAWQEIANGAHSHDDLYYTKSQVDSRLEPVATTPKNGIAVTDANGKVIGSATPSTLLGYLGGTTPVTSSIQGQLDNKAALTHYHDSRYYLRSDVTDVQNGGQKSVRVFVQAGTPTGAAVGDLWIY